MYIWPIDVNHQRAHTNRYRVFSAIVRLIAVKAATNKKTGRHRISRFSREDDRITWWKSVGGAARRRTCRIVRSNNSRTANSTTSPTEHHSGPRHKVNIGWWIYYLLLRHVQHTLPYNVMYYKQQCSYL